MKLFLALVNLINSELINTDDRAYCYAPDIYLQGPFQVQKADSLKNCNERCSNHQQCNFFQFNIRKKKCFFYKSQRKLRSSVTSTRTSIQRNALWVRVQQRHFLRIVEIETLNPYCSDGQEEPVLRMLPNGLALWRYEWYFRQLEFWHKRSCYCL